MKELAPLSPTLLVTSLCAALGCSSDHPPRAPISHEVSAPTLHDGPLTDYVPAAGLRWLIVGRPHALAREAGFIEALSPLVPRRRLDAFASTTGVDLRTTPAALVAGFDFGTLYMAETPGPNERVQALFTDRLVHGANVERPHPKLHRVSGVIGKTPQMLVRIDRELIAVAVGDPTPARVVEAFARRRLSRSPTALRGSALAALRALLGPEPLAFYAPGPFEGEWKGAGRGILGAATALGVGVRPVGTHRLRVMVVLVGAWQDDGEAANRLVSAWQDMAGSSLGRLLELDARQNEPVIEVTPNLLVARLELELAPLVRGLHATVAGDAWEILDLPRPSGVKSPLPPENAPKLPDGGTGFEGP